MQKSRVIHSLPSSRRLADCACDATPAAAADGRLQKGSSSSSITPKKGKKAAPTKPEPLDQTVIHPESYPVANRLLQVARLEFWPFSGPFRVQKSIFSFRKIFSQYSVPYRT